MTAAVLVVLCLVQPSDFPVRYARYLNLIRIAGLVATLCFAWAHRIAFGPPKVESWGKKIPRASIWFLVSLSTFLVVRETFDLFRLPLELDEIVVMKRIAWGEIHSLRHYLASGQLFSIVFSGMSAELFGYTRWAIRLPIPFVVLLFSWGLYRFAASNLRAPWSYLFVVLLVANPLLNWHLNEFRQYVWGLTAQIWMLYFLTTWLRHRRRESLYAVVALFFVAALANMMTGLFCLSLTLATLWWLGDTTRTHREDWLREGALLLGASALLAALLYWQARSTNIFPVLPETKVASTLPSLNATLLELLGLAHVHRLWLFVAVAALGALLGFSKPGRSPSARLLVCHVAILFAFKTLFELPMAPRYALECLVPLYWWIAETLSRVPTERLRYATAALLVLVFLGFPQIAGETQIAQSVRFPGAEEFEATAKPILAAEPESCLTTSATSAHGRYLDWFSREVYFPGRFVASADKCRAVLHLAFDAIPFDKAGYEVVRSWDVPRAFLLRVKGPGARKISGAREGGPASSTGRSNRK